MERVPVAIQEHAIIKTRAISEREFQRQLARIRREDAQNRERVRDQTEWAKRYRETHPEPKIETPQAHLDAHPITAHLRMLGVTKKQFDGVRFRRRDGEQFDEWAVMSLVSWPLHLLADLRAWCALRWLVLDNPPHSRDTRAAWNLIATYMARPAFEAGLKQQASLRLGRGVNKHNETTMREADNKVLSEYRAWEQRLGALLQGMHAQERVTRYLRTKNIPDRQRRRIRTLLKLGKL